MARMNLNITIFEKYNKSLIFETSNLDNSNFPIKQIKIIRGNLVSYKFLFLNFNKEIIQFDFSITEENNVNLFPTIVASVHSIKLL